VSPLMLIAASWPGRDLAAVGPGWLAGPRALGDKASCVGVVDAPANATVTQTRALHLAGWFVDRTASGG